MKNGEESVAFLKKNMVGEAGEELEPASRGSSKAKC